MPALTARQFWLAAANIDVTKASIAPTIDAMTLPELEKTILKVELMESTVFERLSPAVVDLSAAMSIAPEQLDDLWMWAAAL